MGMGIFREWGFKLLILGLCQGGVAEIRDSLLPAVSDDLSGHHHGEMRISTGHLGENRRITHP